MKEYEYMSYFELKDNGIVKVLTHNSVKCLECNEVLISKSRHHFVQCSCKNETFTDGGTLYIRFGARDLDKVENLCKYIYVTKEQHEDMLEKKRVEQDRIIQERINSGEMVMFGNKWISKSAYDVIMKACLNLSKR